MNLIPVCRNAININIKITNISIFSISEQKLKNTVQLTI